MPFHNSFMVGIKEDMNMNYDEFCKLDLNDKVMDPRDGKIARVTSMVRGPSLEESEIHTDPFLSLFPDELEVLQKKDESKDKDLYRQKFFYAIITEPGTENQHDALVDRILRDFRPEHFKDDDNHNPDHLHIEPRNFFWTQLDSGLYGFDYSRPGDPNAWAMRNLIWHLSASGNICYNRNNGFVEHPEEVTSHLRLIFLHSEAMTGNTLSSMVFLLESLGFQKKE